jgi:hypothetical protein
MRCTIKIIMLAVFLVLPLGAMLHAADSELSVAEYGSELIFDNGVIQVYETPLENLPAGFLPETVEEVNADPVITWIAFPVVGTSISNGFKLGSTVKNTIWTYSSKNGKATATLSITDLNLGKVVKTQKFALTMDNTKGYTVVLSYKPTTKHIFYFQGTVLFSGVTKASNLNSDFCKYFIY